MVVYGSLATGPASSRMTYRAAALFLLAVLVLGPLAGPHPCAAAQVEEESAVALPSCHAAATAEAMAMAPGEGDAPTDGPAPDRVLCEKACHAPALVQMGTTSAGVQLAAPVDLPPVELPRSPFALRIDHIPLA